MENEELNGYTPEASQSAGENTVNNNNGASNVAQPVIAEQTQQSYAPQASFVEQPQPSYAQQPAYTEQPQQSNTIPPASFTAPYQQGYVPPTYTPPTYAASSNSYIPQEPKIKKKKKNGVGVVSLILVGLCCSLIGGGLGAFFYSLFNPAPEESVSGRTEQYANTDTSDRNTSNMLEGEREEVAIDITKIDTSKQLTPAEVYALNVNSTVGITTSITTNYWGFQSTSAASGSGFIISDDGYILTNFHVIENSNTITVSLFDGTEYDAELIGYDESNDIAVLKVDAKDLVPVILGDSDSLNVGDPVVAIGNPLGELTFSLTSGAVSAMDRTVTMSNGITMNLIQTDCAINSGNSGGALFNLYGEVVGITNAKYSSSGSGASIDNIGFAIPMKDARKIFESIIEKGYVSKPYIGVSVTDVSQESQLYGLPKGAAIRGIAEDSPAEEAGLKEGDIITHVDSTAVSGSADLVSIIGDCAVGDKLTLTVYRKGETIVLELTVGEQTQAAKAEDNSMNQLQPGR